MTRYVIMSATDAKSADIPDVYIPRPDSWESQHDCLVDTVRRTLVWQDYNVSESPEDMYLYRNLQDFVQELNRLAEEVATPLEEN